MTSLDTYRSFDENEELLGSSVGNNFLVGCEFLHALKDVHVLLLQDVVISDHCPEGVQHPLPNVSNVIFPCDL